MSSDKCELDHREFVFLSEIERFSRLSFTDIRLGLTNKHADISVFCSSEKIIVGRTNGDKFEGHAVGMYRGRISPSFDVIRQIIDEGEGQVCSGRILDIHDVSVSSLDYPYSEVPTPNSKINKWIGRYRPEFGLNYTGHFFFKEGLSGMQVWGGLLATVNESLVKLNNAKLEGRQSQLMNKVKRTSEIKQLLPSAKTFTREDLVIGVACIEELEQELLGVRAESLVMSNTTQNLNAQGQADTVNKLSFKNDLHEVLYNILIAGGDTSHKGVWRTLENELATDEGERQFDKYNILLDVSATELLWVSRAGLNRQTMKFSSLATALSKLKKRIISN